MWPVWWMWQMDVAGGRAEGCRWTASGPRPPSAMDLRDRWLTTTAVADELGLSPESVRRLIRMRRLRASVLQVNDRRTFRILRSELERFKAVHLKDSLTDDWE